MVEQVTRTLWDCDRLSRVSGLPFRESLLDTGHAEPQIYRIQTFRTKIIRWGSPFWATILIAKKTLKNSPS